MPSWLWDLSVSVSKYIYCCIFRHRYCVYLHFALLVFFCITGSLVSTQRINLLRECRCHCCLRVSSASVLCEVLKVCGSLNTAARTCRSNEPAALCSQTHEAAVPH